MADDDQASTPGASARGESVSDLLARLGVEPWTPADVDAVPVRVADVFKDPVPDKTRTGRTG